MHRRRVESRAPAAREDSPPLAQPDRRPPHHRRLQRPGRSGEPAHQAGQAVRPRLPELRERSAPHPPRRRPQPPARDSPRHEHPTTPSQVDRVGRPIAGMDVGTVAAHRDCVRVTLPVRGLDGTTLRRRVPFDKTLGPRSGETNGSTRIDCLGLPLAGHHQPPNLYSPHDDDRVVPAESPASPLGHSIFDTTPHLGGEHSIRATRSAWHQRLCSRSLLHLHY